LQNSKGLPLTTIGVLGYKTTMGVGVLDDSPIRTPKDLEGRTVGWTPTSGEVPFFPVFARLAGVDQDKIKFVNMNIDVRYRAFMDKQIDAITDFAASAIPPISARGYKVRWMLYATQGIHLYESAFFTTPKMIKENPEVCQGMVDGIMEALAFSYLNPEESIDIFFKELREAGFVAKERENVRMGSGIANFSGLAEEARVNGLGWSDPKRLSEMADRVLTYLARGDQNPNVGGLSPNRFAGRPSTGPRADIGVIFQDPVLLPWKSVLDNVLFPIHILKRPVREYTERARQLLDMVGLSEFSAKRPHQLSGGMRQRVAICRALVHDPTLLLMDEPFSALDAITRDEMNAALLDIWQRYQKTVLFVTHGIREAVFLSDRVLVMARRPSTLIADVSIPLPRPRRLTIEETPEFNEICALLRAKIGERHGRPGAALRGPRM